MATQKTYAQTATEAVREMILRGELKPGTRLQAQMLAARLGVSRTPVVDALAVLHKESLLEYTPHRGYGVRRFVLSDLLDAFDVRLTLEALAARILAERGLTNDISNAIQRNLETCNLLFQATGWTRFQQDQWRKLNLDFHDLLLEAAGNGYLTAGVINARSLPLIYDDQLQPIDIRTVQRLYRREQASQAFTDHVRLMEAIRAQQGTRAENMMKEHIFTNREAVRRHLESFFQKRDQTVPDPPVQLISQKSAKPTQFRRSTKLLSSTRSARGA